MECFTTTYTATNDNQPECPDGLTSSNCIVQAAAIAYLGLAANSTQTQINTALVTALLSKDQQIAELDARITALEP